MLDCELSFVCKKSWDELAPTRHESVRYCEACRRGVYKVKTLDELTTATVLFRCVAIVDDQDFIGVIGDTAGSMDWLEQGHRLTATLRRAPDEARLAALRASLPTIFDGAGTEAALMAGATVEIGRFGSGLARRLRQELSVWAPELAVWSEE